MARRRRTNQGTARPYDTAAKHLFEADPAAWLRFVGLPLTGQVASVDADLATVLADADKVVRVSGGSPWLAHLEIQSTYDASMPARLLRYNALLHHRHGLPVASVLRLLRSEADGPALTGARELAWPGARYLTFAYRVVRAWQLPVESILAGDLATLPLAPLADITEADLPTVFRRMEERLSREVAPAEAAELLQATQLLVGLRFPPEVAHMIRSLGQALRESSTYQEILREGEALGEARGEERGRAGEARRILLQLGRSRLGPPDRTTAARIGVIADVERIERMIERVLAAENWADILATE